MAKETEVNVKSLVVQKDKEFVLPEADMWQRGKFAKATTAPGQHGPLIFLQFKLLTGELVDGTSAKGTTCNAMAGADLSPSSTLMKFVMILNGGEQPVVGEELDLTVWYDKAYDIFIEHKENKKNGKMMANVVKLAPRGTKCKVASTGTKKKKTASTKKKTGTKKK